MVIFQLNRVEDQLRRGLAITLLFISCQQANSINTAFPINTEMVNGKFPTKPTGRLLVIVDLLLNNCLHALLHSSWFETKTKWKYNEWMANVGGLLPILNADTLERGPITAHFNCRFELIWSSSEIRSLLRETIVSAEPVGRVLFMRPHNGGQVSPIQWASDGAPSPTSTEALQVADYGTILLIRPGPIYCLGSIMGEITESARQEH